MERNVSDQSLNSLSREELIAEIEKLRDGIRQHRDSSGHELCWHHPQLWSLLPEKAEPKILVPEWPQFMRGCVRYRQSLDEQLPTAPRDAFEFQDSPASQLKIWRSTLGGQPGLEFAYLTAQNATGTILAFTPEDGAFKVSYSMRWRSDGRMDQAVLRSQTAHGMHQVDLSLTADGTWMEAGRTIGQGLLDLWPSPFTNTFHLRNLSLQQSEKREIEVLVIEAPRLAVRVEHQTYTRITERTYLFECPGFAAELQVDPDGIVIGYGQLFSLLQGSDFLNP